MYVAFILVLAPVIETEYSYDESVIILDLVFQNGEGYLVFASLSFVCGCLASWSEEFHCY